MHHDAEGWSFTVLFSNTYRAHNLDKTRDWVVIYFTGHGGEGQNTVITAGSGMLAGRRIVRGRERECAEYYRS
jgi:putative hydrolase